MTTLFPTLLDRILLRPSRPLTVEEERDAAFYYETINKLYREPLMDLDAQLKGLHAFKNRMEKLLDGGLIERIEAAVAAFDGEDAGDAKDLAARVTELAEHVTALEQRFDQLPQVLTASLDDSLKVIDAKLSAVGKLADPAMLDLLDWLARNREAIDVLLSLGETTDGEDGVTAASGVGGSGTAGTGVSGTGVSGGTVGGVGTAGGAGGAQAGS